MFYFTAELSSKTETYVTVAGLKIQFLHWVARVKITRLNHTIVHDGFIENSLLKPNCLLELGGNVFFYRKGSFKRDTYLIVDI